MKGSKRVVIGLLVLSVLLVWWSIFTAARASRLEKRLQQVEASYQELVTRHHAFAVTLSNAMLRADAPRAAIVEAHAAIVRESLGLPPATIIETPPAGVERNAMPSSATGK